MAAGDSAATLMLTLNDPVVHRGEHLWLTPHALLKGGQNSGGEVITDLHLLQLRPPAAVLQGLAPQHPQVLPHQAIGIHPMPEQPQILRVKHGAPHLSLNASFGDSVLI